MKLAIWLFVAALSIVAVATLFRQAAPDRDTAGSASSPENRPAGGIEIGDYTISDDGIVLHEPDRSLNEALEDVPESESPPHSPGKVPTAMVLETEPAIDPATVDYDPTAGRLPIDAGTAPAASVTGPDSAIDPVSGTAEAVPETDDGPLAGMIPHQPDTAAPGPAGLPVAGSTAVPIETPVNPMNDPRGPGTPADPLAAGNAPPNFTRPGDGVSVDDPDPSAPPADENDE